MARSKYEKKVQKTLEDQGWRVDWKIRPRIVSKGYNVDYFHKFDLCAIKVGHPIKWISVKGKSGTGIKQHKKDIQDFWMPSGNSKELWQFRRGMRFDPKIHIL